MCKSAASPATIEQFKQPGHEVVLYPAEYKSGDIIAPYADSLH